MTASPANANDTVRVLNEASEWATVVDAGKMSEQQRLDFLAWVDEPRNARALSEIRTLVALIQELPDKKAASLRKIPIGSGERTAITVAAAVVSVGAGAFGLSSGFATFVRDWFWSGSTSTIAMHPVVEIVVSCSAALAGSILAALVFRRPVCK
jgi:ferric-dicitrate binding protein FerR (iron transport regulator)